MVKAIEQANGGSKMNTTMTRGYNVLGETQYTMNATVNGNEITYIIEKNCGDWSLSWIYTGDDIGTEKLISTDFATKKEAVAAMVDEIELDNSTAIITNMMAELGISADEACKKYYGITA